MSSGLPSGKSEPGRVNDLGIGPYDSDTEDSPNADPEAPVASLPSSGEPHRSYDFYGSSQLPEDDDVPTARSDYYDSLYVGQNTVENLEVQDNDLFGQTIADLNVAVPPDPYEAGVLSSVVHTLFESDAWVTQPEVRVCAADLQAVVRMLRRR